MVCQRLISLPSLIEDDAMPGRPTMAVSERFRSLALRWNGHGQTAAELKAKTGMIFSASSPNGGSFNTVGSLHLSHHRDDKDRPLARRSLMAIAGFAFNHLVFADHRHLSAAQSWVWPHFRIAILAVSAAPAGSDPTHENLRLMTMANARRHGC